MSIYLSFGGGEPEDFASNKGYGDLCRWSDGLGAKAYPLLAGLVETGHCGDSAGLVAELSRALRESPPKDAPTLTVVRSLAESARGRSGAVAVTNGMGAGGGESDQP